MANLIRGKQISFGGQAERFIFTAASTSATVSGTDDAGNTIAYTAGQVSVYLNGVKQVVGTDVTASNGTSVVFAANLTVDDVVEIVDLGEYSAVTTEENKEELEQLTGTEWVPHKLLNGEDSMQTIIRGK